MKFKFLPALLLFFSIGGQYWSQSSSSTLAAKVEEVYTTPLSSFTPAQQTWLENCYSRCSVINESEVPEGKTIINLMEVGVITKFDSSLTPDIIYDPVTFNPLKYAINFHRKYDQYFRIGSTSYILKVTQKVI